MRTDSKNFREGVNSTFTIWNIILVTILILTGCTAAVETSSASRTNPPPAMSGLPADDQLQPTAAASVDGASGPEPTITSSPLPTSTPTHTPTPPAWQAVAPGIQQTIISAAVPGEGGTVSVNVVRVRPDLVTFQMFYSADEPRTVVDWLDFTEADVIVNGGFFTTEYRPLGRMIIDGELYGGAFSTSGRIGTPGLFAVVDDQAAIYALGTASYTPRGLRFDQAIEAYPILLLPGQQIAYPRHDGRRARRTVIGIDEQGHVLIIVVDLPIFTLYELAQWLSRTNLSLDIALNLDGGRSSGLIVHSGNTHQVIPSYVLLPIVIAIYER